MKESCIVTSINPKDLREKDFESLKEVWQDLWAHSIQEFVQCKSCNKMMWKKDIFWHLKKEIYYKTVKKIMDLIKIDKIDCIYCSSETEFVYWDEYLENIKDRLINHNSHIVVAKYISWEIVWYIDWYTDSIDWIFHREYYSHYKEIWVLEIKNRVRNILWYLPNEMIWYSWVGLIEEYSNFFNIFALLREFYKTIDSINPKTPAFTELDRNNNFNHIFKIMWYESLNIHNDEILSNKITNVWENYNSELVIFRKPIEDYRKNFLDLWIKSFLKMFPECLPRKQSVEV